MTSLLLFSLNLLGIVGAVILLVYFLFYIWLFCPQRKVEMEKLYIQTWQQKGELEFEIIYADEQDAGQSISQVVRVSEVVPFHHGESDYVLFQRRKLFWKVISNPISIHLNFERQTRLVGN